MPGSPPRIGSILMLSPCCRKYPFWLAMYSPASSAVGTASTTMLLTSGAGPVGTPLPPEEQLASATTGMTTNREYRSL